MVDTIRVEVVHALPDEQCLISLEVAPGTTMLEAVRQSGIAARFAKLGLSRAPMGVFGRAEPDPAHRVLRAGERVEIYRPLKRDPKAARRARAERIRQGRG